MKIKQNGLIDLSEFLINTRFKWRCSFANGCGDVHMLQDQTPEYILGIHHSYLLTPQWIVVRIITLRFIYERLRH